MTRSAITSVIGILIFLFLCEYYSWGQSHTVNDIPTSGTSDASTSGTTSAPRCPVAFGIVRETRPGSGDFGPVTTLPIFASELGKGSTTSTTFNGASLAITLAAKLTPKTTNSMLLAYSVSGTSCNAKLTETRAGTGLFRGPNGVTVALTPAKQTTADMGSTISVKVTIPSLNVTKKVFTLVQSDFLTFQGGDPMTDVLLPGPLSTTAANTITAIFHDPATNVTLMETGVNTRVFRDADHTTKLTILSVSKPDPSAGSQMQVTVATRLTLIPEFSGMLQETSAGTNQFSNYQVTVEPGVYSNPATDGQGIFYVQVSGTTPSEITLKSGSNQITVIASPVTEHPGVLRTGKLVLIVPNDPFRDPNITTLTVDSNSRTSISSRVEDHVPEQQRQGSDSQTLSGQTGH